MTRSAELKTPATNPAGADYYVPYAELRLIVWAGRSVILASLGAAEPHIFIPTVMFVVTIFWLKARA